MILCGILFAVVQRHCRNYVLRKRAEEMCETLKKVNNALRIVFIGFIAVISLVKVFDLAPEKKAAKDASEPVTSEFDEIW